MCETVNQHPANLQGIPFSPSSHLLSEKPQNDRARRYITPNNTLFFSNAAICSFPTPSFLQCADSKITQDTSPTPPHIKAPSRGTSPPPARLDAQSHHFCSQSQHRAGYLWSDLLCDLPRRTRSWLTRQWRDDPLEACQSRRKKYRKWLHVSISRL